MKLAATAAIRSHFTALGPPRRWGGSLAALWLAASLFLGGVAPAQAETPDQQIAAAVQLFFQGKGLQARAKLTALADAERDPAVRARALESLLEICHRMWAAQCLADHTQAYVDAVSASLATDEVRRALQALQVDYYINAQRLIVGTKPALAAAMDDPAWAIDGPGEGLPYLRRRALRARIMLAGGSPEQAEQALSEVLAIAASAQSPGLARYDVATVLAEVIEGFGVLGAYERAFGLFAASAPFIVDTLPPASPEAQRFRRTAAGLLEAVDDREGAARAVDAYLNGLPDVELDPELRLEASAWARNMKASVCADTPDCGLRALVDHPLAPAYRVIGRSPASAIEVTYLTARGVAAMRAGENDPVAAASLTGPLGFRAAPEDSAMLEAYRLAGAVMALRGEFEAKSEALGRLGAYVTAAAPASALPGSWRRPSAFDRVLVSLSLNAVSRQALDPEITFALVQLAGRAGPGFDADAMTLMASARDPAQRRAAHAGLRLRAQRDQLEQNAIADMAGRARQATRNAAFAYDSARLAELIGLSERLSASDKVLARAGLKTSGANLVSLKQLRGVLAEDEAALAYAPGGRGLVYACVRRAGMTVTTAPRTEGDTSLDARLLEASLSATHAPSDGADSQFPVAAAVRLYDSFIRPFEPCLKPGDRVIWLSPMVSVAGLPLAALLRSPPPRRGEGYDLAAAEWFVKSHAVSYAGSASALVAARTVRASRPARDFLGVGDPVLDGPAAEAVRKAGLGPLPETAIELAQSARPFQTAQVLTGQSATEARVRQALAPGARLISFATHGVLRGEVEGVSETALVLTPGAGPAADDGFLTASEIADLDLSADFVALSACNTANLTFTRIARDLPALSSAFAQAGVRSTLGTLWPVNSETGATVVADVFRRLAAADAPGPAEALAQAQRAYLAAPPARARLHPRFWAPFVILGDGGDGPRLIRAP